MTRDTALTLLLVDKILLESTLILPNRVDPIKIVQVLNLSGREAVVEVLTATDRAASIRAGVAHHDLTMAHVHILLFLMSVVRLLAATLVPVTRRLLFLLMPSTGCLMLAEVAQIALIVITNTSLRLLVEVRAGERRCMVLLLLMVLMASPS